ncbi:hypothetical protein BOX15_Mlig003624g1, partial [Macrostomum lignano]
LIGKARGRPSSAADRSPSSAGNNSSEECRLYTQPEHAAKQIVLGTDLDQLLEQPLLLQQNEWVATHVCALYENVSTVFEAVYDFCNCEKFTGPGGVNFCAPEEKTKKARSSARNHIDSLLTQCQEMLDNFPTRYGQAFLMDFHAVSACVLRHLLHILAHVYACHFDSVLRMDLTPHLNTVARHLLAFNLKFRIVDDKDVEVLADLQAALMRPVDGAGCSTA